MLRAMRERGAVLLNWEPGFAASRIKSAAGFAARAALTFALSRAKFGGGSAPFAMALFAAGLTSGLNPTAPLLGCAAGALWGLPTRFDLGTLIGCAIILAGGLAWSFAQPPDKQRPTPALCALLSGLGTLMPGLIDADGALWPSLTALGWGFAAAAAAPSLTATLELKPTRRFLLNEERAGLLLLSGMLAAGVTALLPPAGLALSAAVTVLARPFGALTGACVGAFAALQAADPRLLAVLAVCGACAQLLDGMPMPIRAIVPALIAAVAAAGMGLPLGMLAGLCLAAPLSLIVPTAARDRVAMWLKPNAAECDPDRLAAMLNEKTADRLRAMGAAFGDLAEGYLTPAALPDEQTLLTRLRGALCEGCSGYADCWTGADNRGARLLCDAIAQAVEWAEADGEAPLFDENPPPDTVRRCRRSRDWPDRLAPPLRNFALTRRNELKRGAENRLISAQFLQAQALLDGLAEARSKPVKLRNRQAERAAGVLERAGLALSDAMMLSGERAELLLTLRDGSWTAASAELATAALSRAFGRVYRPDGAWARTLRFTRLPRLEADIGAACVARETDTPSGDSHVATMLDDERLLAVICDGMGSGEAAARESASAVRLIGRFLAAGADWALAVETVNALLLNISADDMFSTADLMLLNLSTGMADFVKLAAPPTWIAHDGEVQRVEGGRLPLGILERVQPAASRVRLMAGDTVLLASDGVTDAVPPEQLEALLLEPIDDMNALAERVLSLAADTGRDDMTAVCVRVRERGA